MAKWTHVVEMRYEIELLDGTRIGSTGGGLEIGGVDLTPLKDPITGHPYIPGSSLKGKLRSTLEKEHGLGQHGNPCGCGRKDCVVCPVFGAHMNTRAESGPSRLTVRDARFTASYAESWKARLLEGLPAFETKTENTIDRGSGMAKNPRTQERVPAGAQFQAVMILKIFEGDAKDKMVKNLKNALAIIQRFDSLGAGGSRGSGRIAIHDFTAQEIPLEALTI